MLEVANGPDHSRHASGNDDDHEDIRILSAIVCVLDIMEVYSPPRVAEVRRRYWLQPVEKSLLEDGGTSATEENNNEHAHWSGRERDIWLCFPHVGNSAIGNI